MAIRRGTKSLMVGVSMFFLIICGVIFYNNYCFVLDNSKRNDSVINLKKFRDEIAKFTSQHNGKYPSGKGVYGLYELDIVLLSEFAAKDDTNVVVDYDMTTEYNTSYAYIASGLLKRDNMFPIIFEKPWGRNNILVLMSNGDIIFLSCKQIKTCKDVVEYFQSHSKSDDIDWSILKTNAQYIDQFQP